MSVEKHDLAKALKEWHYDGTVVDLEGRREDCEFCGHPDIRYQYEIQNGQTGHSLQIGSECIIRFGAVCVEGEMVDDHLSVVRPGLDAAEPERRGCATHLAVWALCRGGLEDSSEGPNFYEPPGGTNPNLSAQAGLFTVAPNVEDDPSLEVH